MVKTPIQPDRQEAQIRQQLHQLLQEQPPQFIHVIKGWLQQQSEACKEHPAPGKTREK
jgi:hypothetical protein